MHFASLMTFSKDLPSLHSEPSFLVATPKVNAQSVDVVIRDNGKERQESIELPKSMTYPLDSLLNDWKAKNYIDLGKDCSTAG